VLLDRDGGALQVWPARPDLIGTDLAGQYAHLRAAVAGSVAVSNVVPSAARGLAVTAVAVPFETGSGRRVLSGAFTPSSTPLGIYFGSVSAIKNSAALLVDANGAVITSAREDTTVAAHLQDLRPGVQEIDGADGAVTVAMAPVAGTTWRVVQSAPSAELYAPVAGTQWAPWILWGALAILGTVAVVMLSYLMSMRARAAETARTDALTGLPNRRAMEETLTRAAADAARHGQPLAVLMIDLDHFKQINDSLGHRGGDAVLQQTAATLRETLRSGDIAGRWGGEEFLVILQHTSAAGAATVGERVRLAISTVETQHTPDASQAPTTVTASIGVAVLEAAGVDALITAADDALYCAKAAGRNRVIRAAVAAPAANTVLA
jgi:diguanylate cyclase (GGDEF)-like protein